MRFDAADSMKHINERKKRKEKSLFPHNQKPSCNHTLVSVGLASIMQLDTAAQGQNASSLLSRFANPVRPAEKKRGGERSWVLLIPVALVAIIANG